MSDDKAAAALSPDLIAASADAYPTGDAALRLLGPRLATALNRTASATNDWRFDPGNRNAIGPDSRHRLLGPTGQIITVEAYYPTEDARHRRDPWRIQFTGILPNPQFQPSATTAANRPPAAIAAHLRRRLFPGYEQQLADHAAIAARERQGRETARQVAETIADELGITDVEPTSEWERSGTQIVTWRLGAEGSSGPQARLAIPPGAERLHLYVGDILPADAAALGTALNTHYQQRSDSSADDLGHAPAAEPGFSPPNPRPTGRPGHHGTGGRSR